MVCVEQVANIEEVLIRGTRIVKKNMKAPLGRILILDLDCAKKEQGSLDMCRNSQSYQTMQFKR